MTENTFDSMFERAKEAIKKEFIANGMINDLSSLSYHGRIKEREEQLREERQRQRMSSIHETFSRGFFKGNGGVKETLFAEVGVIPTHLAPSPYYILGLNYDFFGLVMMKFSKFVPVGCTKHFCPLIDGRPYYPLQIGEEVLQRSNDFLSNSEIEHLKQLAGFTPINYDVVGKSNIKKLLTMNFVKWTDKGVLTISQSGLHSIENFIEQLKESQHAK